MRYTPLPWCFVLSGKTCLFPWRCVLRGAPCLAAECFHFYYYINLLADTSLARTCGILVMVGLSSMGHVSTGSSINTLVTSYAMV